MSAMPPTVRSPGGVDPLERDPPAAELGDRAVDVGDVPAHLGVLARRLPGGCEQGEVPGPAAVEQAALACFDRVQAELLGVERASPLEILGRQPRGDLTPGERPAGLG